MIDHYYEIIGGKIDVTDVNDFIRSVQKYSKRNQIHIQICDANKIYGKAHIESSIQHALRSYDEKRMTTNSVEMEFLLYVSGERQLKNAIPKMGINSGKNNIALVFIYKDKKTNCINDFINIFKIKRDDDVLKGTKKALLSFGITEEELSTVSKRDYQNIILEHVAMVDIVK